MVEIRRIRAEEAARVRELVFAAGSKRAEIERRLAVAAVKWLRDAGAGPIFRFEDAEHPHHDLWEGLGFVRDVTRFSLYEEDSPG